MLEVTEQQWFFRIGLVILVLVSLALILRGFSTAKVGVFGAICGLALTLVSLPDIQSFGFGPLKADMRKEIGKAKATVEQVRALAGDLSQVALIGVQGSGRIGGVSRRERSAIRDRIVRALAQLGLTPQQIKEATSKFDLYTDLDHRFDIRQAILEDTPNLIDRVSDIDECLSIGTNSIQQIPAADVKACLEAIGPLGQLGMERIKDLETFQATGELRRPEVYFSRE